MDDAALDQAKEQALAETEEAAEESVDENEAVEEEVDSEESIDTDEIEDNLPQDHKERSNLGRKVEALFRKTDTLESLASKTYEITEHLARQKTPEQEEQLDEYVTRRELEERKQASARLAKQYEDSFIDAYNTFTEDMSDKEKKEIGDLLMEKYNVKETGNGYKDGIKAVKRAYAEYTKKAVPLKQTKPVGGITKQKSNKRGKPLAKLDKASEALLNYIKKRDGAEKAERIHKNIS